MFEGVTLGDRYQVYGKIGGSSLITRFDGIDTLLARPVDVIALTPLAASDPDLRDLFQALGRAAATRSRPHIVDVYDIDVFNGQPFVVTEHLSGESLRAIIEAEAPFHPDDVVALIQQLAPAADNELTHGVGGAMVSADTVMVDASGIARHSDFLTFGTRYAAAAGSWSDAPPMPPPVGAVQAIATIAYQLMTGEQPETGPPRTRPPSAANGAVTPDIDRIVLRGLDPRLRDYPSAAAFAAAFTAAARRARQVREQLRPATPVPPEPPPALISRPRPVTEYRPPVSSSAPEDDEPGEAPLIPRLVPADASRRSFPWTAVTIAVLAVLVIALAVNRFSDLRGGNAPTHSNDRAALTNTTAPSTTTGATTDKVPSLVGMTRDTAAATLAQRGLLLQEVAPVYSDTIASGAVAEQVPPPGAAIPGDRTVHVKLSQGPSSIDLASLSLSGMSEADARRTLQTHGLVVQSREAASATMPAGAVISVDPAGVVRPGATVTLAVSVGNKVQIPRDIFSMPLSDAKTKLAAAGIQVAGTIKVGPAALAGRINMSQYKIASGDVVGVQNQPGDAAFGAWIARDSAVTLVYFDASS